MYTTHMYLSSYILEMPDYSIRQVEQAEYQLPKGLGEASSPLLKNPIIWIVSLVVIGLLYHKVA
jgi:hypothetical protein